jgi:pimeloyl-ACP methyl ester carboxylesterase
MEQRIRYCKTADGVKIAYATAGSGPALVVVPPLFSHLESSWDNPAMRPVWETYARHFTLVRYDKRGTGLSDRSEDDYSLEARLRDLEAIVADLGLSSFTLRGTSEGGPVAIAFAARHPERISKLILFGTYASGRRLAELRQEFGEALIALAKADWSAGPQALASILGYEPSQEQFEQAARRRDAMSPQYYEKIIRSMAEIELIDELPRIAVPTLVVHGRDDRAIPFELGRMLASAIPNARLQTFEGGHQPTDQRTISEVVRAILDFMLDGHEQEAARTGGALVTILFTDLASSTALTQRLGDAGAQGLVRAHNAIVRDALTASGGTEIKHTGDGIMASFPTASGALDCAIAIQRAADAHNQGEGRGLHPSPSTLHPFSIHIGLNAGEPVAEESDLFGTAVQLARRICDHASGGQVLASNVVRELAAGKGFLFSDIGEVVPKGFEDPVRLYEVRWREGA